MPRWLSRIPDFPIGPLSYGRHRTDYYYSYSYGDGYGRELGYHARLKNYLRKEAEHAARFLPPPPPSPPQLAFGLVCFFAPPKLREAVLGDFENAFLDNVDAIGVKAANWSYRYQVLASLARFLWARLFELLQTRRSGA